ncbi:MAG TPA: FAD-dependent oxidoreductase [Jatrophihabitantaceae bacterium]
MASDVDVVIVGAGLAGAAAAWSLARRGRSVALFEQFEPSHALGSSHGSARIVRRVYEDALYVSLTGEAFELWREVESAAGVSLLRILGGLDFGPRRNVPGIASVLTEAGVPFERVPPAEAEARWPGMRFEGDVIFHPQAGTMDAAGAVTALVSLAASLGATVRYSKPVSSVSASGVVGLADGTSLTASHVVVAAGGWVSPLLEPIVALPPMRVTQQQIFHFPRLDPSAPPWPSVIHESAINAVYHLAGGRDGGPLDDRKIGEHDGGTECSAASRSGVVDPASEARVVDYVRRWLPGLSDVPSSSATCLYTETPSQDFILDRVGPIVVCSPCSGHGAKFAPLVGELVAGLIDGTRQVPPRFRLATHRSGLSGAVSL